MKLDRNKQTEQNTGDFPLLKPGEYDFEVEDAVYKKTSTGKMMWTLKLRFEQPDGPDVMVWENFVEADADWSNNRFLNFFDCIGVVINDTDKMADTVGEMGRAKVGIEKGTDGYADKNKVKYWIPKKVEPAKKPGASVKGDDLPF